MYGRQRCNKPTPTAVRAAWPGLCSVTSRPWPATEERVVLVIAPTDGSPMVSRLPPSKRQSLPSGPYIENCSTSAYEERKHVEGLLALEGRDDDQGDVPAPLALVLDGHVCASEGRQAPRRRSVRRRCPVSCGRVLCSPQCHVAPRARGSASAPEHDHPCRVDRKVEHLPKVKSKLVCAVV